MAYVGTTAVVSLNRVSGIKADAVENVFHFVTNDLHVPTSGNYDDLADVIEDFFSDTPAGGAHAICYRIALAITRAGGGCGIQFYTQDPTHNSPLGVPAAVRTFTMGADSASAQLPSEIAVALSYQRTNGSVPEHGPGGTRPKARTRGRLFIGPLEANAFAQNSTTHDVFVASDFSDDLCRAAHDMVANAAGVGWTWVGLSRADNATWTVANGWVDNAPDVQRRRGQAATSRQTWTA